jgi:hypothetical protein
VSPSSVEAVETVEAVIHPAEAPAERPAEAPEAPATAPQPNVETPAADKAPAQDASAA